MISVSPTPLFSLALLHLWELTSVNQYQYLQSYACIRRTKKKNGLECNLMGRDLITKFHTTGMKLPRVSITTLPLPTVTRPEVPAAPLTAPSNYPLPVSPYWWRHMWWREGNSWRPGDRSPPLGARRKTHRGEGRGRGEREREPGVRAGWFASAWTWRPFCPEM